MGRTGFWLLSVIAVLPLLAIAAPIASLLWHLAGSSSGQAFGQAAFWHALAVSLAAAAMTCLCACMFGLPAAYLIANCPPWLKRTVDTLLLLPLMLPPIVGGMSTLTLYGPYTLIGRWFSLHNLPLTDSLAGIVLAQTFVTGPFLILSAQAGFESVPAELIDAARLFGGGFWSRLWQVSIPLSRQAIIVGIALTFARSMGEFGATLMMAYHPATAPIQIWLQFQENGLQGVLAPAAILVAGTGIVVWLAVWVFGKKKTT